MLDISIFHATTEWEKNIKNNSDYGLIDFNKGSLEDILSKVIIIHSYFSELLLSHIIRLVIQYCLHNNDQRMLQIFIMYESNTYMITTCYFFNLDFY